MDFGDIYGHFCHQHHDIINITVNLTKNSECRDRTLVHFERIPKNVTHPAGLTGLQNGLLIFLWDTEQSFTFPASIYFFEPIGQVW